MAEVESILDDEGARVEYRASFLDASSRRALFEELDALRGSFDHDQVRIFGRTTPSPRLVAAFGDEGTRYRYSGVDRVARPWPPVLRAVRDRVVALVGQSLTYGLVNLYRDGHDRLGWHADDESDIVRGSCIASVSVGAARPFQLRRRHPKRSAIHEVWLADGSLLLMHGATQEHYKHQLPARARITEPRFNVTLRQMRDARP
jgi:alkylated DNA repair dioxygenase AlkB